MSDPRVVYRYIYRYRRFSMLELHYPRVFENDLRLETRIRSTRSGIISDPRLRTDTITINNDLRGILFIRLYEDMEKISCHRLEVFDHFQGIFLVFLRSLFTRSTDVLRRCRGDTGDHCCDRWFSFRDNDVRDISTDEHEYVSVGFRLIEKDLLERNTGIDTTKTSVHLLCNIFNVGILHKQ